MHRRLGTARHVLGRVQRDPERAAIAVVEQDDLADLMKLLGNHDMIPERSIG